MRKNKSNEELIDSRSFSKKAAKMVLLPMLVFMVFVSFEGCEKSNTTDLIGQENAFGEMLVGSWKYSDNDGDVILTFGSDKSIIIKDERNEKKDEKSGTYSFNSDNMTLNTTVSGWSIGKVTSITSTILVIDGKTFYKIEAIETEEDGIRGPVATKFNGSGTKSDPYLISNASELRKLSDDVEGGNTYRGKYFKMTNDITINRNVLTANGEVNGDGSHFEQWKPIGFKISGRWNQYKKTFVFQGEFDGDDHKISGIYITVSEDTDNGILDYIGLFGYVQYSTIKNLTLMDSYIYSNNEFSLYAGGIVGMADGKVTLDNCYNYATVVKYGAYCHGIVHTGIGMLESERKATKVTRCANHGKIIMKGDQYDIAYGIGDCGAGIIDRCVNYGEINSSGYAYGIGVGNTINSVNVGKIDAKKAFGITWGGTEYIYNSHNYGELHGELIAGVARQLGEKTFGSLVPNPIISNCLNTGSSNGNNSTTYGILYFYDNTAIITNNYCLDSFCESNMLLGKILEEGNGGIIKNNRYVSEDEIKTEEFLKELNSNAEKIEKEIGMTMARWKFGDNGFPTLDFMNE